MNREFGELKARLRRLEAVVKAAGTGQAGSLGLVRAVDVVRRLVGRGDRSAAPSAELLQAIVRAEALAQEAA